MAIRRKLAGFSLLCCTKDIQILRDRYTIGGGGIGEGAAGPNAAIGGGGIGEGAAGPKLSSAIGGGGIGEGAAGPNAGGGGIGEGAAGPRPNAAIGGGGIGEGAAGPSANAEVNGRSRTVTERIERTNSLVMKVFSRKFARCTRVPKKLMCKFPIWKNCVCG